jgi:phage FluMu gp28-like protein
VLGTYEGDPIRLDDWQTLWLWDHSRYRALEKAPQLGWSWLCAAEALWECLLFEDATSGFVSVSQREASDKILYARKLYDGLPEQIREWVPLAYDATDEMAFGDRARPARLLSFAATSSLRGRRMHVYLDEVDFYRDGGEEAFRIGIGRTTRGLRLSMGSTVFGEDTQLHRVMAGAGGPRRFSTAVLPYLVAEHPDVVESIRLAHELLDPEDFDEEYGCRRGGGASESFTAELIRARSSSSEVPIDPEGIPALPTEAPTILGLDVGGSRHPSVLNVWQRDVRDGPWRQRAVIEWRVMPLPDQEAQLRKLMRVFPDAVLGIDANGIGLGPAQALEAEFGSNRVVQIIPGSKPAGMPAQTRGDMATTVKRLLEGEALELVQDREQAVQLNRTRIHSGGKVEQHGSKKRTHFDRFWSLAYAAYVAGGEGGRSVYEQRDLVVLGAGGDPGLERHGGETALRAALASDAERQVRAGKLIACTDEEWPLLRGIIQEMAARWTDQGQGSLAAVALEQVRRLDKVHGDLEGARA